jgi:dihydrofolate reductase/nitroimidazol reductase NimA-like FMN-containing flavoprotein (pyridoxamine 5'-phosphate oxidase superfamily)
MTGTHGSVPIAEPYLVDAPAGPALAWETALAELERGSTCWLATTARDGRPHVVPVLAVVVDGATHVASAPGSRKARNLVRDARASLTTHGSRLDVVIEGSAQRVDGTADIAAVAAAFAARHGWEVEVREGALHGVGAPTAGAGPYHVYRLAPTVAFGFPTDGDLTPTRWRFPTARGDDGVGGRVLWHTAMSLDGFIAGPDDAMAWVFEYDEPEPAVDRIMRRAGAMLIGRRTYEVGRRDRGEPSGEAYEGAWTGPQLVLTHHPPEDETDPSVSFLAGTITDAVQRALTAAAGRDVVVLGADVARQCLDAGLIDEVHIRLTPVLLGEGVRLYGGPGLVRAELHPIEVDRGERLTHLGFRVVGAGG